MTNIRLRAFQSGRTGATLMLVGSLLLAGCSQFGRSGPPVTVVTKAVGRPVGEASIVMVNVTATTVAKIRQCEEGHNFSTVFGEGAPTGAVIGKGDSIDVSVWEAPPAALFGTTSPPGQLTSGVQAARSSGLPEQQVDQNGEIAVPFVGTIHVAGREARDVESEIARRLHGRANQPQVVVRITKNAAHNMAFIGDVANPGRFPLTPKGERLLDILADAGGVKQSVVRTMVQLTRDGKVVAMPLDEVIRDPRQNIRLAADDVVTALYQPWSFIALGATSNNADIPFEATGMTLAQALGRAGGLQDSRADLRGVFLFRFEDPAALDPVSLAGAHLTSDGKVPVIYRLDLRDAASFFVAQNFMVHNRDVLYVSNAPGADTQKIIGTLASLAYMAVGVNSTVSILK